MIPHRGSVSYFGCSEVYRIFIFVLLWCMIPNLATAVNGGGRGIGHHHHQYAIIRAVNKKINESIAKKMKQAVFCYTPIGLAMNALLHDILQDNFYCFREAVSSRLGCA